MSSGEPARGALCLDGCDRIDIHPGGTCEREGKPLTPGPLDLVHRHPDIPVAVPVRNLIGLPDGAVLTYDMVLPRWPYDAFPWTPFRDRLPRASACYRLPSGNMVHVKPGCRC